MQFLYIAVAAAGISLFICEIFYTPKSRIRRLWNEIFKIEKLKAENIKKSGDPVLFNFILSHYELPIEKKKKMINALLDYYFDPEVDAEYIEENRPK